MNHPVVRIAGAVICRGLDLAIANVRKGQFREEDHPRADDGKFGSGGGGKKPAGGKGGSRPAREALREHLASAGGLRERLARLGDAGPVPGVLDTLDRAAGGDEDAMGDLFDAASVALSEVQYGTADVGEGPRGEAAMMLRATVLFARRGLAAAAAAAAERDRAAEASRPVRAASRKLDAHLSEAPQVARQVGYALAGVPGAEPLAAALGALSIPKIAHVADGQVRFRDKTRRDYVHDLLAARAAATEAVGAVRRHATEWYAVTGEDLPGRGRMLSEARAAAAYVRDGTAKAARWVRAVRDFRSARGRPTTGQPPV